MECLYGEIKSLLNAPFGLGFYIIEDHIHNLESKADTLCYNILSLDSRYVSQRILMHCNRHSFPLRRKGMSFVNHHL